MLVGGRQVASTVDRLMFELGERDVSSFLDKLDKQYEERLRFGSRRDPPRLARLR